MAVFGIDAHETLSIARSYCDAMREHGHDMETSEQAIQFEQHLLDSTDRLKARQPQDLGYGAAEHSEVAVDVNEEHQQLVQDDRIGALDEIKDLVKMDTRTIVESRALIDILGTVLGSDGMRDLQNGNPDAFKNAGLTIDARETLSIAKSYCDAMRQHGYDPQASEQAIIRSSAILDVQDKIALLEEERRIGEEAHKQNLGDKESYGL
ncbi:hypothetical protein [Pseudochrobactrum kiredjianiae]|uniref:Uncharacterized protein n=1 Tax=Pseudochrobactrum kiredjianiae TaxID=386305 RepID=A0ABW3UZX5_9HYPH|nr:hypothetical protein [Pseudochrobactrum kiredjianiae]MDM7852510.1 hypothetical protein [Pseudochrobactrum kiredjianiae]